MEEIRTDYKLWTWNYYARQIFLWYIICFVKGQELNKSLTSVTRRLMEEEQWPLLNKD